MDSLRERVAQYVCGEPRCPGLCSACVGAADAILAAIAEHSPDVAGLIEQARKIGALRIGVRDSLLITEMAYALAAQAARIAELEARVELYRDRDQRAYDDGVSNDLS